MSWKESPDTTNFGLIWALNFNTMEINGVLVNAGLNLAGHFTTTTDTIVQAPPWAANALHRKENS